MAGRGNRPDADRRMQPRPAPCRTASPAGDFVTFDITAYVRVAEGVTVRGGVFNAGPRNIGWWQDIARPGRQLAQVRDAYTQPGRNGVGVDQLSFLTASRTKT